MLVVHRAGAPKAIRCLKLVLPGPSVLAPTQGVSDGVGTGSSSMTSLIVLFLQLSPFLGQLLLGSMLTGFLVVLLLFCLLGDLLIPFQSHNAG